MSDDISKPQSSDVPVTSPLPAAPAPVGVGSALEVARERTIRVLTDRFADDTLSIDEFEARLDRMYQASTPAELDALLRDVEARVPRQGVVSAAAAYGGSVSRRLLAIMSNTERTGRWPMPRQLHVRALMSSVLLDLREVALPPGLCEIDVLAVMTNVEIIVPPGVIVEELALGVMANVENAAVDDGSVPSGAPRIRITGTAVMANIEVQVAERGLPPHKAVREYRRMLKRAGLR